MTQNNLSVQINGVSYPCYPTMGAMLRFKQLTGHDVTEMQGGISDIFTYLYCCIVGACAREKVAFEHSLSDLADLVTPELMSEWTNNLQQSEQDEKKSF